MRLPRDISGNELAKRLAAFGYQVTRQSGSHIRLTTQRGGEHYITIPQHNPLRVGTLAAILSDIAGHLEMRRDELAEKLFGS